MKKTLLVLLLLTLPARADDLGLRVAPGFKVSLYADENLANDIYAMTLDSQGRVVVTSKGYVKTLHDTDGDGKADKATLFTTTNTGGMGLCFDGNDLYFCGDGWFSRYRDADGDGRADGPPEKFIPLAFTEHGGHAMRKGPDGWWYIIGGNDSKIGKQHATLPNSPIRDPEAGALLRLPPDCSKGCEIIAHGFRNPYDFDFNAAGDIFTYDSDVERDYFLPWYSPTRIYHVAYAGHHGWRVNGFMRSWARRDFYLDTVDILQPIGRGSPTGVVCYRHDQFPEHYRGGVFALDWTFGKVWFLPLKPEGTTYKTEAEVFIEPTGTHGFAPTDAVVAPDGSLYISIGGRGTRGAIYKIEAVDRKESKPAKNDLERVLNAPQPLDAWSRARWEPMVQRLGAQPFLDAVVDPKRDPAARVRAIEILTELFDGLSEPTAREAFGSRSPLVQARVAWSFGRYQDVRLFGTLFQENDSRVRLAALDAWLDTGGGEQPHESSLRQSLGHPDKRIRQAAARLIVGPLRSKPESTPQGMITAALASVWHHPEVAIHEAEAEQAAEILSQTTDPALRLQAVRLIVLALGDWHLKDPSVEIDTAYSVQPSLQGYEALTARLRKAVRPLFPSTDPRLNDETARLLAILKDDDPGLPARVADFLTLNSTPTRDLHYLIVLSRLDGPIAPLTTRVADALLSLDRKLDGQELRIKQTWNERLAEVTRRFLDRCPDLAEAMLRHPKFVAPGHVALALCLSGEQKVKAARLFLEAGRNDDFGWSGPLIELFSSLPTNVVRPAFRAQWDNYGLRDALLLRLVEHPEESDRDKFLGELESAQPQVVREALSALEQLPRDPAPEHLAPILRLIRRLALEPKEAAQRAQALALVNRQSGQTFAVREEQTDPSALRRAYGPVFSWFERDHPAAAKLLSGGDEDLSALHARLKTIDWSQGDAARGAKVFQARACQTCHTGQRALGPDLTGVAGRLARDDLFNAIAAPSLDVSPLYRTTIIETRDGRVFSGLIAFESADGLIVQTGAATTVRVATPDIVVRRPGIRSLMPDGLLKDLQPGDLADLYSYLQTLTPNSGTNR